MSVGKLYLVPTPIGNLKDITLRALEVLKSVDIVAAEDTRQTLKLLNHFEIKKSLISYHKHNEQGKSEDIIQMLKEGKNIAIVTAITTALVYSGLDTTRFLFRGFIPRENKERKILLNEIKDVKESIILYESPYRILNTLETLLEYLGNRNIAVCRELTKLHEEIKRGTIKELIEYFKEISPKGEFVLVVQGKPQEHIDKENKEKWENLNIREHILSVMESGVTKKEAIKYVAKERGLSKNEVYKYAIDI